MRSTSSSHTPGDVIMKSTVSGPCAPDHITGFAVLPSRPCALADHRTACGRLLRRSAGVPRRRRSGSQFLAASLAGYLVGEFLNSYVLVKMKERTGEASSGRLISSTVVGELADTIVFCSIAATALGISTWGDFVNYTVVGSCGRPSSRSS